MIETTQAIKLALAVAGWSDEERKQILTLADAFKAQQSTVAPKKLGPKPGAKKAAAKDPNRPKRKYTKRAKPEEGPKAVEKVEAFG